MGKLLEFAIFVEGIKPQANGNQLSGQVIVNLKEPMKMRSLKLVLKGEAYCHWTEQHGSGDNRRTVSYTGREQLINMVSYLFTPPAEGAKHPNGRFSYPFVFVMPSNLPSSIELRHGHIKYHLKATIDKPWKFDHDIEQPLVVTEPIDTNNVNFLTNPGGNVSKEVGCCIPSGMLSLDGHLNRAAFCAGESIIINAQASNQSRTDMNGLKAKLVKKIEYHASSKTRRENTVLSTIAGPGILRGETGSFANQPINVPQTSPSILSSNVIKCYYQVYIEVDVPCGFDLDLKLPVTIGTIPFRGDYGVSSQNNWVAGTSAVETSFQSMPSAPVQGWSAPPDEPPPYSSLSGPSAPPFGMPPPGAPPSEAPHPGAPAPGAPPGAKPSVAPPPGVPPLAPTPGAPPFGVPPPGAPPPGASPFGAPPPGAPPGAPPAGMPSPVGPAPDAWPEDPSKTNRF